MELALQSFEDVDYNALLKGGEETGVFFASQTAQFLYVDYLSCCRHYYPRRHCGGILRVAFPKTTFLVFISDGPPTCFWWS